MFALSPGEKSTAKYKMFLGKWIFKEAQRNS